MTIFLSHPMHGLTDDEIMALRQHMIDTITSYPEYENATFVDNYNHESVPDGVGRVWHLGESIKQMDGVDLVIFTEDYTRAYGCWVEHLICECYNIPHRFVSATGVW